MTIMVMLLLLTIILKVNFIFCRPVAEFIKAYIFGLALETAKVMPCLINQLQCDVGKQYDDQLGVFQRQLHAYEHKVYRVSDSNTYLGLWGCFGKVDYGCVFCVVLSVFILFCSGELGRADFCRHPSAVESGGKQAES